MSQPDYQDDTSIADEDRLFRRIHSTQIVKDDNGFARVSSGAFRDKEMSVNIESVLLSEGKSAADCLQGYRAHKLVSITAGAARQFRQAVCRDPLPEDSSHGLVCGSKSNGRVVEGLRSSAKWVIPDAAPLYSDVLLETQLGGPTI
jgi:hypothetical protein